MSSSCRFRKGWTEGCSVTQLWSSLLSLLLLSSTATLSQSPKVGSGSTNERYEVTLLEDTGECCPRTFEFRVLDKAAGAEKSLILTGRVAELKDIRLVSGDRLAIVGRLRYGGDIVVLGDLDSGEQMDVLWAHSFGFSPSERYLIYESHYPRHVMPIGRRSILLLYDLDTTAEENRLLGFDQATDQHMAGIPVYPASNAFPKSYDVRIANELLVVSPYLWSEDGRRVAFVARSENNTYDLVLLNLEDPLEPEIWERALDVQSLILPERKQVMSQQEIEKVGYGAGHLEWDGPDRIILHTDPHQFLMRDRLVVELPTPKE